MSGTSPSPHRRSPTTAAGSSLHGAISRAEASQGRVEATVHGVACPVCRVGESVEIEQFRTLIRVTSDAKPWHVGGQLWVCQRCGLVYKPVTQQWRAEATQIYAAYDLFFQSGGEEQAVFSPLSGVPAKRSRQLIDLIAESLRLPPRGRLLDIGSGRGETLRAAAERLPTWQLYGSDLDDRYAAAIRQIGGVRNFFVGDLRLIGETFDLITLVHVAEHIADAETVFDGVARLCGTGGRVIIHVPDHRINPFDLLVADHAYHFVPRTLRATFERLGFTCKALHEDWIPKELTLIAIPGRDESSPLRLSAAGDAPEESDHAARAEAHARRAVGWLAETRSAALALAHRSVHPFGIFGTSIAATWLASELGTPVSFFVDEDPNRIGRRFMGRPVVAPQEVVEGATVFICLAPTVADTVESRLSMTPGRYIPPPPFDQPV